MNFIAQIESQGYRVIGGERRMLEAFCLGRPVITSVEGKPMRIELRGEVVTVSSARAGERVNDGIQLEAAQALQS